MTDIIVTPAIRKKILALTGKGLTQREISAKTGVSAASVGAVQRAEKQAQAPKGLHPALLFVFSKGDAA